MELKDEQSNIVVNVQTLGDEPWTLDSYTDLDALPILPTRDSVIFPMSTIPLSLGRENSLLTARAAADTDTTIGIVCQKRADEEHPTITKLHRYGVLAQVMRVIDLPDGSHTAIVRTTERFRILGRAAAPAVRMPQAHIHARVELKPETTGPDTNAFAAVMSMLVKASREFAKATLEPAEPFLQNMDSLMANPSMLLNFLCTNLPFQTDEKAQLIAAGSLTARAEKALACINGHREKVNLLKEIAERTKQTMSEGQRNAFLQTQMENIRQELYGDYADDADALAERAAALALPQNVQNVLAKEIDKLRRYNPQSPDYAIQYTYIDTVLALPWTVARPLPAKADKKAFAKAAETLDKEHYGLEKVKERILEQLAMITRNPAGRQPILCLVGPPGVGKTSLGKSIADALGKDYQRVALGGLHDEAEIRGHRRTYIGAMPGRIIDAMKRAGSNNPVLLLDEIDKIGHDFKGDPASALLEVLDPEQNCHFHDNYIDIDFDLSGVLFVATANTLSTVPPALLDRMEIIELSGYLPEEKQAIAEHHLMGRILQRAGLESSEVRISPEAMRAIIDSYTAESGVRQLEKCIEKVVRKAVHAMMADKPFPETVAPEHLHDILGLPVHRPGLYEGNDFAGVVTGLAWTSVGGEILLAEVSLSPGKGEKLAITGNLGDVMKESATIALQWVKAHAAQLGIDPALFEKYTIHIHFPEGAIPKDGPSAGITIATAIVSAFRQCRVAPKLAMTGEITLRGRVLPVGGIKEKILAAKRAGITDIVLSADNRRDIDDIAPKYRDGLTFHYVGTVLEVMRVALTDQPVPGALSL
ncbi:MAG: endopeptidase La [Muribaculaceae bacterium]|nr:endopeptidase La [Muribaculaceae bacterium]